MTHLDPRYSDLYPCTGVYGRLAAATGAGLTGFSQSESGAAIRTAQDKLREVLSFEDFFLAGEIDDTAMLRRAAAAIVTRGGGTLRAKRKNYNIWTSDTSRILDFRGANGVVLELNGATFTSKQVNTSAAAYFIDATSIVGLRVSDFTFIGGNTTLTPTGEQFLIGANGTSNVRITNGKIKNTQVFVNYGSGAADNVGLFVEDVICDTVYYPTNIYQTTLIRVRYQTINCGRSIVLQAPIYDFEYWVDSQHGGPFSDCVIGGHTDSTKTVAYNTIANGTINYRTSGRYPGSGNQSTAEGLVSWQLNQTDTNSSAMHFRKVTVNIVADASAVDKPSNAFVVLKYKSDGTGDTVARGHTIRDCVVSASLLNWNNATVDGLNFFPVSLGGQTFAWTGDTIENIALRDVRIVGAAPTDGIYLNGQGAVSGKTFFSFNNVTSDGNTTLANVSTARIEGFTQIFTPGISFGALAVGIGYGAATTGQFTIRDGRLRGNAVVSLSSKGSSVGVARITGLPFAVGSGNQSYSPPSFRFTGISFTGQYQGYCDPGTTTIVLEGQTEAGGLASLTDASFINTSTLMVAFDYPL